MPEYRVDLPSGQSYSVKAYTDEQAQKAINDLTGEGTKTGGLEAFGRAAVNNLPLGGQAAALGTMALDPNADYSSALEDWNKTAATAKAEHPVAYGAGAVTGAVTPALLPGVGEMGMAGNAALGAGYGMGNVDVVKHPGEAVKQGLMGAGIGMAAKGLMNKFAPSTEGLEDFANKKGVQGMGIKPGELGVSGEEIQDMGNLAHETGLFEGSTEEKFNKAKDILNQVGNQIGDLGGGKVLADPTEAINELHGHIQQSTDIFGGADNPEMPLYRAAVNQMSNPEGVTFERLQALKNSVADRAFDANGGIKNEAAFNVYKTYSNAMEKLASDHPDYPALKNTYSSLKSMADGLERQLQNEQARGAQSHGIGMMGRMGGAITGGNVPATLAASAALAPAHPIWAASLASTIAGNPAAMEGAARGAAAAIPAASAAVQTGSMDAITSKLFNTMQTNPQSLGKFASPLMNAAKTGGSRGIAATHFLLANQYPEYNELVMHGLEHKAIEKSNETIGSDE